MYKIYMNHVDLLILILQNSFVTLLLYHEFIAMFHLFAMQLADNIGLFLKH